LQVQAALFVSVEIEMITSPHNDKLKLIRKLQARKHRERTGLFCAEGEDLVEAAERAGAEVEFVLVAGRDVDSGLLDAVSELGSGTRAIGVYRQAWSRPGGELSAYLEGVRDPGNVGTIIRTAHALADGPVILGPGCADPYSPRAVRASMGSVFARPPATAALAKVEGFKLALDGAASEALADADLGKPLVLCLGGEREGLPADLAAAADATARIPMRPGAPDSLNVASAAAVGLYEVANRMADRA
jgi:TrmH family RNA methyltransferase